MCIDESELKSILIGEAVGACDEILSIMFGSDLLKADLSKAIDPLSRTGYARIVRDLSDSLVGLGERARARATKSFLRRLDVDWPRMSEEQVDAVVRGAREAFGKQIAPALPTLTNEIRRGSKAVAIATKKTSIARYKLGVEPAFNKIDQKVVDHIASAHGNYVTMAMGRRSEAMSKIARRTVSEAAARGLDRWDVVDMLERKLGYARSRSYWEVVAASYSNQARTWSQIHVFADAGIPTYVWESVLDEVTTETCRFMHGKTFPVNGAIDTINRTMQPDAEIKETQPWVRDGKDAEGNPALLMGTGSNRTVVANVTESAMGRVDQVGQFSPKMTDAQLVGNGLSLPPIHGLCRSTVLPGDTLAMPRVSPGEAPRLSPAATLPIPPSPKPKGILMSDAERKQYAEAMKRDHEILNRKRGDAATQERVRNRLREQVESYGMTAHDVNYADGKKYTRNGRMKAGTGACHTWGGEIQISSSKRGANTWDRATRAYERVAANPQTAKLADMPLSELASLGRAERLEVARFRSDVYGSKAVIHEAVHGTMPSVPGTYRGFGVGLEEATTEIPARRITRDWLGLPTHNNIRDTTALRKVAGKWTREGSYGGYLANLARSYETALGATIKTDAEAAALWGRLEEASFTFRSKKIGTPLYQNSTDALMGFVNQPALGLNAEQQSKMILDLANGGFVKP